MIEKHLSEKCWNMWHQILWIWAIITLALIQFLWFADGLATILSSIGLLICTGLGAIYMKAYWRKFKFTLDDDEIRVYAGVWWQTQQLIPFSRITNIAINQGPWQRARKLATLRIETAGQSGTTRPESLLWSQEYFEQLRDDMLKRVSDTRSTQANDGTAQDTLETTSVDAQPPWEEMVDLLKQIEKNIR